jgi:hypothetical protein
MPPDHTGRRRQRAGQLRNLAEQEQQQQRNARPSSLSCADYRFESGSWMAATTMRQVSSERRKLYVSPTYMTSSAVY